ncbi:MAG: serine/threonine-protein kinase [Pirellulaceae bacterium]
MLRITTGILKVGERPLGQGGMGDVWRCRDHMFNREIAVKFSNGKLPRDDFVSEARNCARLANKMLPKVLGMGETKDGQPWYAMELISGRDLISAIDELHFGTRNDISMPRQERALARSEFDRRLRIILRYFCDICSAIEIAHEKDILHCDISPLNIRISESGDPFLLDWGLACVRTLDGNYEVVKGKNPRYQAPEQAQGKSPTEKTDIFLLGTTLFHILTGSSPYGGRDDDKRAQVGNIRSYDLDRAPVAGALKAICRRATAAAPEHRFHSVAAMRSEIENYLAGDHVSGYTETVVERTFRAANSRRNLAVTIACTSAALLLVSFASFVAVSIYFRNLKTERDTSDRVVGEFVSLLPDWEGKNAGDIVAGFAGVIQNQLDRNQDLLRRSNIQGIDLDFVKAKVVDLKGENPGYPALIDKYQEHNNDPHTRLIVTKMQMALVANLAKERRFEEAVSKAETVMHERQKIYEQLNKGKHNEKTEAETKTALRLYANSMANHSHLSNHLANRNESADQRIARMAALEKEIKGKYDPDQTAYGQTDPFTLRDLANFYYQLSLDYFIYAQGLPEPKRQAWLDECQQRIKQGDRIIVTALDKLPKKDSIIGNQLREIQVSFDLTQARIFLMLHGPNFDTAEHTKLLEVRQQLMNATYLFEYNAMINGEADLLLPITYDHAAIAGDAYSKKTGVSNPSYFLRMRAAHFFGDQLPYAPFDQRYNAVLNLVHLAVLRTAQLRHLDEIKLAISEGLDFFKQACEVAIGMDAKDGNESTRQFLAESISGLGARLKELITLYREKEPTDKQMLSLEKQALEKLVPSGI